MSGWKQKSLSLRPFGISFHSLNWNKFGHKRCVELVPWEITDNGEL